MCVLNKCFFLKNRVMFCNSLGCNSERIPWSKPVAADPAPKAPQEEKEGEEEEEEEDGKEDNSIEIEAEEEEEEEEVTPKPEFR